MECLAFLSGDDVSFLSINIGNNCCKISLFADDLSIYWNGDLDKFEVIFQNLNKFSL